jgi:hypothetical protein
MARRLGTPAAAAWFECDTIEGNTDAGGSREGDGVMRRVRRFYPKAGDRFIRWADLDRRVIAGQALQALAKRSTSARVA